MDGRVDAQPHIFVSYRRTDGAVVRPVIAELERQGYRVWYDVDGIGPGGRIASEIQRNIENCAVFLAFLSKSYYDSDWCMDEINLARNYGKLIIPVKLDKARLKNGLGLRLAQHNIVSWRGTETLIRQMRRIPECEKCRIVPTPEPFPPPEPEPLSEPEPALETRKKQSKGKPRKSYPIIEAICAILIAILIPMLVALLSIGVTRAIYSLPEWMESRRILNEQGWLLKDGVLTISKGILDDTGRMPDYHAPWTERRDEITKVIIRTGIPNIGINSFRECKELKTVSFPDSIEIIDWCAFYGCTDLTGLIIPDSVTEIRWRAFYGCDNLSTVYILGSEDSVQIDEDTFPEYTSVIYGPPPKDAAA